MPGLPLKGCNIVVTRPAGQADKLVSMLETAGARAVRFPVIEIIAANTSPALAEFARSLETYQLAIFISRNAVIHGINLLNQARSDSNWPPGTKIAAIGSGTTAELEALGLTVDITSRGIANSENLLTAPEMLNVAGKRVLIFRGTGGREKLADVLRARGAIVDYIECYRRELPARDAGVLTSCWNSGGIQGIIVTSCEGLENLYQLVDAADLPRLNNTPLYVISSTMVELSRKLGYKQRPILARSASNQDVLESLVNHCTAHSGD
jgi:uroporphyrinogen-III synthase